METVAPRHAVSADSDNTQSGREPDRETSPVRKQEQRTTAGRGAGGFPVSGVRRGSRRIDHRQGVRHRVLALVKVYTSGSECSAGLLYEVSADGMFVLSEEPPTVNQCVDIEFALSPAWDMALTIKGIVVHSRNTGFGLMFREPDDPALALLGECLR
jgi:hypothetical protein